MRVVTLILSTGLMLIFSGAVHAQTWTDYVNRELGFAINLPGEPVVQDITYTTRHGTSVPAHAFSLEQGTNRYLLTVVEFLNGAAEDEQTVAHAADVLRQRGEVSIEGTDNYDPGIPGSQLSIFERDGRHLLASIYMYRHRLYIVDGSVAPGDTPPVQFQQSIMLINPDGSEVNIDSDVPRGGDVAL